MSLYSNIKSMMGTWYENDNSSTKICWQIEGDHVVPKEGLTGFPTYYHQLVFWYELNYLFQCDTAYCILHTLW